MPNNKNKENDFFNRLNFNFDSSKLKAGDILISEPFLADENFSRSVVLLAEYTQEDGAFGFIINKPTDLEMNEVMKDFNTDGFAFHNGGPVSPNALFFLHNEACQLDDSNRIRDDLFWSSDWEGISDKIQLGTLSPKDVKFIGGYSGWSANQLEEEIKMRSWIIGSLTSKEILSNPHDKLWKDSLRHLGSKFSIMAQFPENPELN